MTKTMQNQLLKDKYTAVVNQIASLQHHDRYEGAFIFGSYVTDELHEQSDLDVVVLVADGDSCSEVSHPRLQGIPVDISFNSFERIQAYIQNTLAQGLRRKPWLCDSQILFDKRGRLQTLADRVRQHASPTVYSADEYEDMQITGYYDLIKARKLLNTEPEAALLVMQTSLDDLLRRHYKIHGRWRVSNKKILSDLQHWDPAMYNALRDFLIRPTTVRKFAAWEEMIDLMLAPLGGRDFAKYEGVCSCEQCQRDLRLLLEA